MKVETFAASRQDGNAWRKDRAEDNSCHESCSWQPAIVLLLGTRGAMAQPPARPDGPHHTSAKRFG